MLGRKNKWQKLRRKQKILPDTYQEPSAPDEVNKPTNFCTASDGKFQKRENGVSV